MRISTAQAFNNGISGLQNNYGKVTRTQEEISTGKKILTPADDPVASVKLLQLSQEEALNDQYKTGMTSAKNSLNSEEAILNSVGTVIQRVRELAVQAGNGALDSKDRSTIGTELAQREDELLTLLNSKDASGKYLFSGNMSDTQPFVREADGTYTYKGDEGQRQVQIASSTFIAIGDNGKDIFESANNTNRIKTAPESTNTGSGRIALGLVEDKVAYDQFAQQYPQGVGVYFSSEKDYYLYDLAGTVANPPAAIAGTNSALDTTALSKNFIRFGGAKVQFDGAPVAGDKFNLKADQTVEKRSLLNVVSDLRKSLQSTFDNPEGAHDVRDFTAVALGNLDSTYAQVLSVQGKIGARLNTVDTTESFISDVSLVNKSVMSDLGELDYPEALTRLSLQNTVMQAAQQSFVKISGLSLFNYL